MGRPRKRSDAEILDAAQLVVDRFGPGKFTLAAVATEIGLTAAALIQRFGSKRGLLLALTRRRADAVPQQWAQARGNRAPLDELITTLCDQAGCVADPGAFSNALAMLHLDLSDPEFYDSALRYAQATRHQIEALLIEAIQTGDLRDREPQEVASRIEMTYNGTLMTWAIHRDDDLGALLERNLLAQLDLLATDDRPRATRHRAVKEAT